MSDEASKPDDPGAWRQDARFVLSEISRLSRSSEHVDRRLENQDTRLTDQAVRLERVEGKVDSMATDLLEVKKRGIRAAVKMNKMEMNLANLQFRQTVFGTLGVAVPSAVAAMLWWLSRPH